MARLALDSPTGVLRGQAVRFCSVCCRFNPGPGQLCPICRATQGRRLLPSALSIPVRIRTAGRIVVGLLIGALVWSALITEALEALVAVGFYLVLGSLILVELRAWARRRPPCSQCGSPDGVRMRFAGPGVPLIAAEPRCTACRGS